VKEAQPTRPVEKVDTRLTVDPNKQPFELTFEEFKVRALQEQNALAQNNSKTLSADRYGNIREAYNSVIEKALIDNQPVPEEVKQAYYQDKKQPLEQRNPMTTTPAFKKWFGDSKVVDENGQPLVVYHGTKADFQIFDIKKAGASDPGLVGKAFYFTDSAEQAKGFSESNHYGKGSNPTVMPVYLSIENPYYIHDGILPDGRMLTDVHPNGISDTSGKALQKEIKRSGYDGVIFTLGGEVSQLVVFDQTKIKSVNNYGTFDPTNPNILFQEADPRMPLGGYEEAAQWKPEGQAMDEIWTQEISPLLDKMEETAKRRLTEPGLDGAYKDMSPEGQKMLQQYLKGVQNDLASTKDGRDPLGRTEAGYRHAELQQTLRSRQLP
jgi:hypothetical protein